MGKQTKKPQWDREEELVIDGAVPCQIPDGLYEATVSEVKVTDRYKRRMVDFLFRLATPGFIGLMIPGYAALKRNGKPGSRSKLTVWWLLICEFEKLARRDRISLRRFREYQYQVQVGKSKKDGTGQEVPEGRRVSTVQEILTITGRVKR